VIDGLGDADVAHLRIGEDFIHLVDRSAGDARVVDALDPLGRRPRLGDLLDRRIEPVAVLRSRLVVGVVGIVGEMLMCPSLVLKTPVGMLVG